MPMGREFCAEWIEESAAFFGALDAVIKERQFFFRRQSSG